VDENPPCIWISFASTRLAVFENAGKVQVPLIRTGNINLPARVFYETKDGTALGGEDFKAVSGWLEFPAMETAAQIEIVIIDDKSYENSEDFFVHLSQPEVVTKDPNLRAEVGERNIAQITIIDDDDAGMLCFETDVMTVHPPALDDLDLQIKVRRMGGGCGRVTMKYAFEGGSAIQPRDFHGEDGQLVFGHGEMEGYITVTIKAVPRYDVVDQFRIKISDPTGGACLDATKDGGADKNILTVMIVADSKSKDAIDRIKSMMANKWSKSQVGHHNWATQFKDAFYVNGGGEDEDDPSPPTIADYVAHCITVPWKLLFALVPPTDFCGGWVCFFCSLVMIGIVTMLIGEMASLLGCVMCLPDDITAITFVALGTSLPDTFASKASAEQDPHADASVGNVTGSNCVNVFLGLGLPWMIAAFKWRATESDPVWDEKYQYDEGLDWLGPKGSRKIGFVVEAGSLGFSVAVFSSCAVITIGMLALRRKFCGGELGGSARAKWGSVAVLIFLWLLYIGLSAWQSISSTGGMNCPR